MRLNENDENIDRKRFIEIGFNDFYHVVDCAVRAHQSEDAVIWYDDPIDNNKPAGIGSQPASECKATNGFVVKANPDWAMDLAVCAKSGGKWQEMIGTKVYEVGMAFIEWCEKENNMVIIVTK